MWLTDDEVIKIALDKLFDKRVNILEWHGTDWESRGYNSKKPCHFGYEIHIANAKCQQSIIAEFAIQEEMKRVVKLWNATRHLSDKYLENMCDYLILQRNIILKKE